MDRAFSRAVITGGAGFIGSHLVRTLLSLGTRVLVFDNLASGRRQNLPIGAELIVGDIGDVDALKKAIVGADLVVHLAAVPSVVLCQESPFYAHSVNMGGTISVIEAVRDVAPGAPILFASSAAVYGIPESLPLSEAARTTPLGFYGFDKLNGERALALAAETYGLRTAALRLFNVYGERQDPSSPYSGVISIFGGRLAQDKTCVVFGDGAQSRDFVRVEDVASHFVAAAKRAVEKPGFAVYNVCTGQSTTISELYGIMAAHFGVSRPAEHGPEKPTDIRHSVGNRDLAAHQLRAPAPVPFGEGLLAYLQTIAPVPRAKRSTE